MIDWLCGMGGWLVVANNVQRDGGREGCWCEVCGGEWVATGGGEELVDEECCGEGFG